ncbi:hypothetical protein ABZ468_42325 [Streptomyces sp. NPDC005708]|uniref:hypothetical protein n=1 Tax=Streptomyces sp. NPDC005708 TaxID=3154564 RepID=UPI0033D3926D
MSVVVLLVGGQDLPGVSLVHDEDVVESLAPNAADDPLAGGVHPGSSRRVLDLFGLEDGVEGSAVLVVPIP